MDQSKVILGTIDKWQVYADSKGNLRVLGMMNNIVFNTETIIEFDTKNKVIKDKTGNYRLGTSFNSYQIAYYRLARGRKVFDEPGNH